MSRASILAVGTEIVAGQITNRNAVWISERLVDLGLEVVAHLSVPDDHARIRDALAACARGSELLVVTGGLGPTTDDFTRDVVAEWSGRPLEFRPAAWTKIERRLSERGIEVAPSNRQQCFFPRGATVLENLEGTADGFRFDHRADDGHTTEVIVLPGPPREGMHLWDRFVDAAVAKLFPATPADLERWHCLGKSESSLGEIVEAAVAGFDVRTGYRATVPYVEVKIWIENTVSPSQRAKLMENLNRALEPYSIARNGEDLATRFANALTKLAGKPTFIVSDSGTGGRLTERLITLLRTEAGKPLRGRLRIVTEFAAATADAAREADWTFTLSVDGEATIRGPHGEERVTLPNPYPNPAMAERLGGYQTEMALLTWTQSLTAVH